MIQHNKNFADKKKKGFESGQKLLAKSMLKAAYDNAKLGRMQYNKGILSKKTINTIENLGFGVDQNQKDFGTTEYIIRWYDCTKGYAAKCFKRFMDHQDDVLAKIQMEISENMSKGYHTFSEYHLSLDAYNLIQNMGFGVKCEQLEFGINTYIITWHDSTEGLANEMQSDFESCQEDICKEILSKIDCNVDAGLYIYNETYLTQESQQYFRDMGYVVVGYQNRDGRVCYRISWFESEN